MREQADKVRQPMLEVIEEAFVSAALIIIRQVIVRIRIKRFLTIVSRWQH